MLPRYTAVARHEATNTFGSLALGTTSCHLGVFAFFQQVIDLDAVRLSQLASCSPALRQPMSSMPGFLDVEVTGGGSLGKDAPEGAIRCAGPFLARRYGLVVQAVSHRLRT